jgi:hypothetical protein
MDSINDDCAWFKIGSAINVPGNLSLAESLTWIGNNAADGGDYTITLSANETIAPKTLSYSGKNVSITMTGGATERTVYLSSMGSIFTVGSGVTLMLGGNVTLQGRSDNTAELVKVNSGGTLVMNTGSKVSGNSNSFYGAGVGIYGGTFIMEGGTISNNTITGSGVGGAGVYLWPSSNSEERSVFTMNGGTISGNTASCGAKLDP